LREVPGGRRCLKALILIKESVKKGELEGHRGGIRKVTCMKIFKKERRLREVRKVRK